VPAEVVAPPASSAPAAEVARSPDGEDTHTVPAKVPAAAHAGKVHRRPANRLAKKSRAETDLDSPLNPYAR
jgi:hypothetical protein